MNYLKEVEQAASPTVSLESLFVTLVIGDYEGRYIATDVPGSYLQDKMTNKNTVILKLQGGFVDIVCDVNPYDKDNIT